MEYRNKMIVANWKMNLDGIEAESMLVSMTLYPSQLRVVICPPAVYLESLIRKFERRGFKFGGQNCSHKFTGPFTGQISPIHLKDVGAQYVLIGHSDCREYYAETHETLVSKIVSAAKCYVTPIYCIGEPQEVRNSGEHFAYLKRQIDTMLEALNSFAMRDVIIAYEPVWSIGSGVVPTNEEIEEVVHFIREQINCPTVVLYGGSVSSENISQLCKIKNIDGFLVGKASLRVEEINAIINCVVR